MPLPPPTGSFIRRDAWIIEAEDPWDPYSLGYAKAVGAMQALSKEDPDDPRGWTYQSWMHGFPPQVSPQPLFGGCQHGSWYFLPWHRMYVYMFERIVRSFVLESGGPEDWALPFWNWTKNRALPPAFREQNLPGGDPNPLFVADHRNPNPPPGINGGLGLPQAVVETDYAFSFKFFNSGQQQSPLGGIDTGFGGAAVAPKHYQSFFGGLEDLPHNHIHDLIGGPSNVDDCGQGWMCDPNCAAQDPIFWLHHTNIDRLWVQWNSQGGQNPTDTRWTGQEFSFFDSDKQQYSGKCSDVVTTVPLGYTYQYPSVAATPPEVLGVARPSALPAEPEAEAAMAGSGTELGASKEPVALGAGPAAVTVPLVPEGGEAFDRLAAPREERESIYLTLEDVKIDAHPGVVYSIYLNKPAGVTGAEATTYRAGLLSFFGLMHAHEGEGHEGHAAPTSAYDVTSVVAYLKSREAWDPSQVEVTFEPLGLEPEGGASASEAAADYLPDDAKVEVGKVTLRTGS